MMAATFTTTLGEMNRLYGIYVEATKVETPNVEQAERAWIGYETYVRRYKSERGLQVNLGSTVPDLAATGFKAPLSSNCTEPIGGFFSCR